MPNSISVQGTFNMVDNLLGVLIYQKHPHKHKINLAGDRLTWVMFALSYALNNPQVGRGSPYIHVQLYGSGGKVTEHHSRLLNRLSLCMYQHTSDINLMGYNATITMTPEQAKRVLKRLQAVIEENDRIQLTEGDPDV